MQKIKIYEVYDRRQGIKMAYAGKIIIPTYAKDYR